MSEPHARRVRDILRAGIERPGDPDWYDLPAVARKRTPEARAVVGYGSWYAPGMRKPRSYPDVYLVVDRYEQAHESRLHAWMNHALPPNVYYHWSDGDGNREVRGKINVVSAADLERECSPRLRDAYNAGRMTKLVWLAWARDDDARDWVVSRLVDAHATLVPLALAPMPESFSREAFSLELLGFSYRAEPRLEGWEHVRKIHRAHPDHYRALHDTLLVAFAESTGLLESTTEGFRKVPSPQWEELLHAEHRLVRRSRWRGYLRWPRIILTEPNLADLAASEAERKAGVHIHMTPSLHRHPLLLGLPEFLRVLRERRTEERIRRR